MERPGGVADKSDHHHIVNMSASSPDDSADQPPAPLSIAASTGNSSALTSSVSFRQLLLRLELALVALQITASVVGLACSTHEKPQAEVSLRGMIAAYAIGCVAALPPLCWDHSHPHPIPAFELDFCFHRIIQFQTVLSLLAQDDTEGTASRPGPENPSTVPALVEYWRIALNAFFAYWLLIAGTEIRSVWSSSSAAPILSRLWVALFAFSCLGHVLGLIICPMLRLARILTPQGGASPELINALPAHTFKLKGGTGGVVAAGTDKERVISGDDAVCSICLATYADGDDLRELPCSHLLHRECVDKWLKIKATCPLCKSAIRL
uniref:RING-type domain-containing protein n=1 Tax=Kalanchoe fedtschenkoi TaxID=63787 RepID=A0A7N0U7N4_KALFE